ncbi:MAG: nitrogenase [Sporomusaceae bacterium]|nr:nitrogenase [Sporomusaceae bacterium]
MAEKKEGNVNYRNVNENPCNMCMPMGGILALKGIEGSMVIVHGSQGCSTYMRRHIAEHFNEPVDVGSSSLNEKGTIYGGEKNLRLAFDNIIKVYHPKMIGLVTTCLAETIGEDIERIASQYVLDKGLEGFPIITASTPGYGGSHFEGYFSTLKRVIMQLTEVTSKNNRINIIIPNMSPADIRELKRIMEQMNVEYVVFPDISDTLDRPFSRPYTKMSDGGTKLTDIKEMGGGLATIQMGVTIDDNISPGKYLEDKFGVPLYNIPIPIGLENTDLFINIVVKITGKVIPEGLKRERGRLLDGMIDSHKYNFSGRCVIFGEPEMVYAVAKTCLENGVFPAVIATGSQVGKLNELLAAALTDALQCSNILIETDFAHILAASQDAKVNIAIGPSDGRYLTEKGEIPLVRLGFPIHDRVGGQRLLSVGYTGTMILLDRITNTLLENKYKSYRSSMYEKFYRKS